MEFSDPNYRKQHKNFFFFYTFYFLGNQTGKKESFWSGLYPIFLEETKGSIDTKIQYHHYKLNFSHFLSNQTQQQNMNEWVDERA